MYEFDYHRASSVEDAANTLKNASDGTLLAGGQTLIATLKQRLASPSDVIDISALDELGGISVAGGSVSIGAATKHCDVAGSGDVVGAIAALSGLAGGIGDPHVRHAGTIGGSIANNDPAADYPAACLGLGATITTNTREIAADDFFSGLFETALGDDEIITKVSFPVAEKAGYAKFDNPASRYAIVGVFVAKTSGGVRVAVTGAGDEGVFRVPEMEAALSANFSADALNGISVSADNLIGDIHASVEYRAHLISVMAKRAVQAALG